MSGLRRTVMVRLAHHERSTGRSVMVRLAHHARSMEAHHERKSGSPRADGEWILRCTQNDKGSADGGFFASLRMTKGAGMMGEYSE